MKTNMSTYVDSDGFTRETWVGVDGEHHEIVRGFVFVPFPRSETGAFGGGVRNCTPKYPAAESAERAMKIARQRGESEQTGRVMPAHRSTFGQWCTGPES